ncbi:hypothetical protein BDV96DRAFT_640657 [Lophiotrema nucula]|uniref:Aminoglycoside phosphotransferase domain-containing protein n=1 Tax=Lophiotrema nucula TaxID=690887 RepID=A0A6A5ZSN3_9PLEO|nr:hypothetical protein BDV96DRAFT_640657 [Lophiotrema nucula]
MLGHFLEQLHAWGLDPRNHNAAFESFAGNISAKDLITQELFTDFLSNIKQSGYTATSGQLDELQTSLMKLKLALHSETESVAMGDFWMGNVLINRGDQNRLKDIFVIDWEFVNMAPIWLDVGNFIGELFLISYFEGTDDS